MRCGEQSTDAPTAHRDRPDSRSATGRRWNDERVTFHTMTEHDVEPIRAFLRDADLTLAGLDEPTVHLWIEQEKRGQ